MINKLNKKAYIIYGLGVSYFMLDQIFVQWINFFYLPPDNVGLNPLLTARLLTLGYIFIRLIDAIADPVVGYLSDHSKSRFGKRSFFMILGGIPLSLSMILFFYPNTSSQLMTFLHFIIIGSLFFVSYTLVGGPYNALVADLSKSKKDRINLSTVQSVFRLIFSALPMIFSAKLIAHFSQGNYSVEGFRKTAIIFSILSAIGVYICAFFLNEKKLVAKSEVEKKGASFRETVKKLKNKEIVFYFIAFFCFFSGFNIIRTVLPYYVSLMLKEGTAVVSSLSTLLFIAAAVFFPLTNILTKKFGFKKIMILNLVTIIIGVLGLIIFNKLAYAKIFIAVIGAGTSGAAFIFPPAMLSEIATKISTASGVAVEGLLFGIQGFFLKLAFMTKAIITINAVIYKAIPNVDGLKSATYEGTVLTLSIAILLFVLSIIFYSLKKEI